MDEKKGNFYLKSAIGILAICLFALGFYTVQFYNESTSHQNILAQEKKDLKMELQTLLLKYEEAIKNNENLKQNFSSAQGKIKRLMDSIDKMEATYVFVRRYKMEVNSLKREKEAMFRTIDSLSNINISLQSKIDSAATKLAKTEKRTDSLALQNEKLAAQVSEASKLKIANINAAGVIIRNSGTLDRTEKAGKAEKIQVCFTLLKNDLAPAGRKELFVQIIDPKNNLLGDQKVISFGEAVLNYSKEIVVLYENKNLETCVLIGNEKENLLKGSYIVNIFRGAELLSSEVLKLN
ncbi:MAG TPA: hypothetical protein VFM82_12505 [Flavobacteriaceae bacterium]|nr:hypothetical protein [Flavobacteriaceae bacterium]